MKDILLIIFPECVERFNVSQYIADVSKTIFKNYKIVATYDINANYNVEGRTTIIIDTTDCDCLRQVNLRVKKIMEEYHEKEG